FLTQGILTKTSPVNAKAGLSVLLDDTSLGGSHPVMVLWQTFFDRIDPANYDRLVVLQPPTGGTAKQVFMTWTGQDATGKGSLDSYSPSDTLTLTAQIMGLKVADPTVIDATVAAKVARPVKTSAVYQYATDGTHDGHFIAFDSADAIRDWKAFLTSMAAA